MGGREGARRPFSLITQKESSEQRNPEEEVCFTGTSSIFLKGGSAVGGKKREGWSVRRPGQGPRIQTAVKEKKTPKDEERERERGNEVLYRSPTGQPKKRRANRGKKIKDVVKQQTSQVGLSGPDA